MAEAPPKRRAVPCYHARKTWPRDANGNVVHPKPPPAPEFKRPRAAAQGIGLVTAYANSRRDPLEVLSMLAGGTTFRVPGAGGGRTVGKDDLAHCLGFVKDRLAQCLALAVATHSDGEWAEVLVLAYPKLLAELGSTPDTRHLVRGKKRHRVRIVLRDAFIECTCTGKLPPVRDRAKAAKMRWGDYLTLLDEAKGFLKTWALVGAHVAVRALYGGE